MWFSLTLLSAFFWGFSNVVNSMLVAKYEKNPVVLMWVMTFLSMLLLLILPLNYDVHTDWMFVLMMVGAVSYLGDLYFFRVLDRIDISVVNAAWAIQALLLSLIGFFVFRETWTPLEGVGAALILSAVLLLAFFHAHISMPRTLGMLLLLGALYIPASIARKTALLAGVKILPVFYWLMFARETIAFCLPWCVPSQRRALKHAALSFGVSFYLLCAAAMFSFYLAEYLLSCAYAAGPISLIAIAGNLQPFFVLFLGGLLVRYLPAYAPKEVFSIRSTSIKLYSFIIVFLGLALLALSQ